MLCECQNNIPLRTIKIVDLDAEHQLEQELLPIADI
jgi:hypothetical protein